tara:strand:- start:830 stop:1009 length:180 start_codon:yes stop_codon:yes gene_type:complete
MNLGILFLKFNTTGVITLSELDWITNNQSEFSRLDMALVLKIGRLMDEGIIELDCRLQA